MSLTSFITYLFLQMPLPQKNYHALIISLRWHIWHADDTRSIKIVLAHASCLLIILTGHHHNQQLVCAFYDVITSHHQAIILAHSPSISWPKYTNMWTIITSRPHLWSYSSLVFLLQVISWPWVSWSFLILTNWGLGLRRWPLIFLLH